jgi:hypothetical protein
MTFGDMKQEVSRRLAEVSGRVVWSDDEIATAILDGYAEMSDATDWYEASVGIDLLNDHHYYDLRAVIGETFLALRPAFDVQTNRWLIPSSVHELDAHDRRWERVTGEPYRVFLRGLWWLGFYPRIQTEAGVVTQYYTALPPPLSDDTDEPGFPETFHDGPIAFAMADLLAQDAESKLALLAWEEYLAIEAGLTAWVEGRASGPMLHGFGASSQ